MLLLHVGMHTAVAVDDKIMLMDGLRGAGLVDPNANMRSLLVRRDYEAQIASPAGVETSSFARANWTVCPVNSYADRVGSDKCSPCPDQTHTAQPGAISLQSCRLCSSDLVCHGHGTCVVNEYFQPLCDCETGYLSTDNCHLPLMYLYSGAGGVFVIMVAICVILCWLYKTRQKHEEVTQRRLQRSRSQVAQLNSAWQV